MTLCIVTLETRPLHELLDYHNRSFSDYAARHGYEYKFLDHFPMTPDVPVYWKKLFLLLQIMDVPNTDYVMWVDSDMYVNRPSTDLRGILQAGKSIFMGRDGYGILPRNLNAGIVIIRNDEIGRSFLSECIDKLLTNTACRCQDGTFALKGQWAGDCYEQGVMNKLIQFEPKYKQALQILGPSKVLNTSCSLLMTDPIILHHFGSNETATQHFRRIRALASV